MFPKQQEIDWNALTDKEFARQIALRKKQQDKLMTKPVSDLTNEEMMEAIKAGRFDK